MMKKKVIVVLPAYNAARTLERTVAEIPDCVDQILLTDDASSDATVAIARKIGLTEILRHDRNRGYGGNQKTCYDRALELGADIVIMLHPDYQYTPKLIPSMVNLIEQGLYDVVLGSRILGRGALQGGMPRYKYLANRMLTLMQNMLTGEKLSEYHTGYRAFSRKALEGVHFHINSDNFLFDNQMLAQLIYKEFSIAEITCPARYFEDASSIGFAQSLRYGLGCIGVSFLFRLNKLGIVRSRLFDG